MYREKSGAGIGLKRSLNLLVLEIFFAAVYNSCVTGVAYTGFTRMLGINNFLYGVIMAMPVIGGVLQVFASHRIENTGKRKRLLLIFGFINRSSWVAIALIPFAIPSSGVAARVLSFMVIYTLSASCGSIATISYLSLVGDLVPSRVKGRFFSKRTIASTVATILAGLAVGKYIDGSNNFRGFAAIFAIAAAFGVASIACYLWMKSPNMKIPERKIPFLKLFAKPFHDKNYSRFLVFIAVWQFGVCLSDPFAYIYMLENLKMSYFVISILTQVVSSVMSITFIRVWGRKSDRFGSKPVLGICCSVTAVMPFVWLTVTPGHYAVILVINLLGGIFIAGYNLNATNMSLWLAPKENRSIYAAVYNLVIAVLGTALAYTCGGAILQYLEPALLRLDLPFVFGQRLNNFHVLFALAGVIRLAALLVFLPKVDDKNATGVKEVLKSFRLRFSGVKG